MEKFKIEKPGYYELLKDMVVRNAVSIGTLPVGTIVHVTQVDAENHMVYSPSFMDWVFHIQYVKESKNPVTTIGKEPCYE